MTEADRRALRGVVIHMCRTKGRRTRYSHWTHRDETVEIGRYDRDMVGAFYGRRGAGKKTCIWCRQPCAGQAAARLAPDAEALVAAGRTGGAAVIVCAYCGHHGRRRAKVGDDMVPFHLCCYAVPELDPVLLLPEAVPAQGSLWPDVGRPTS